MRKSLLLLVALGPLAALTGLALPAVAESGEGSCVSQSAAEPLNLEAIPAKPVTGPQAVQGVDDECDDVPVVGKAGGNGVPAGINVDDDRRSGEGRGESDNDND